MLGHDLVSRIAAGGYDVLAVDRDEIDITDPQSVDAVVGGVDVVVNVAAFTAVDKAEEQEAVAFAVNATGPEILARRCKSIGARLVHISTDYVFGGESNEPYAEDEILTPCGAYGRTKAAGEWAVRTYTDDYLIVRTAWLYGRYGHSFPATMKALAQTHASIDVVTDEVGQPTWTVDLADLIVRLVDSNVPSGIYHGTSSGETNWNGFARAIMESIGKDPTIIKETTAAAFDRPAPRPHYSVLSHDTLRAVGVEPIGNWLERWRIASPIVLGTGA
ncbi:MAG: dTDP-4-dehydrorhamnose reductase [Ancrocorticia sp.]|jgi:dTDP-4-dehydrorhamnose reductase|nr:dTDP-4-dehydrorhamnose reductase [Ancrocorticia sp.]